MMLFNKSIVFVYLAATAYGAETNALRGRDLKCAPCGQLNGCYLYDKTAKTEVKLTGTDSYCPSLSTRGWSVRCDTNYPMAKNDDGDMVVSQLDEIKFFYGNKVHDEYGEPRWMNGDSDGQNGGPRWINDVDFLAGAGDKEFSIEGKQWTKSCFTQKFKLTENCPTTAPVSASPTAAPVTASPTTSPVTASPTATPTTAGSRTTTEITISLPTKQILTMCEVEVYSKSGKKLSLTDASQISTSWSGVASRAIDGNTNPDYNVKSCTATDGEDIPWWKAKIHHPVDDPPTRLVVTNRNIVQDRLKGFIVKLGDKTAYVDEEDIKSVYDVSIEIDTSTTKSATKDSTYVGCFKDAPARDLSLWHSKSGLTTEQCIAECTDLGYAYAGMQYASHCFCGQSYGSYGKANNCDRPCTDGPGICGGSWANSVYDLKKIDVITTRTATKITIGTPTHTYLALCEVEVYSKSGKKLVLNNASQSSVGWEGVAARAIDGNKNPSYGAKSCTHTVKQFNPWWTAEIDHDVDDPPARIVITNRDGYQDRIEKFFIQFGGDVVYTAPQGLVLPVYDVRIDETKSGDKDSLTPPAPSSCARSAWNMYYSPNVPIGWQLEGINDKGESLFLDVRGHSPRHLNNTEGLWFHAFSTHFLKDWKTEIRFVNEKGLAGPWQVCVKNSPIGLDIDHSGAIEHITGTFKIDITGDGDIETLNEWFAPTEGILIDMTHGIHNGTITGHHMFGDMGGVYSDGFAKLKLHDDNRDGIISGAELDGFALWIDANSNTKLDDGELSTLQEHDVVSLRTDHTTFVSSATLGDGSEMYMEDLWFAR